MKFILHPNITYLLIVTAMMLMLLTFNGSKSIWPKITVAILLLVASYECIYLKVNAWAFLVLMFSPLPYFIAMRQGRAQNPLFLITIFMLAVGSFLLLVDQDNRPLVHHGLAGFASTLCGIFVWITSGRMRNAEGVRLSNDPNSVVGLIGEAETDIELHSAGSVLVQGELWQALSKNPILAGDTVRVLRQQGFWLTVKKVENLPGNKSG